MLQVADDLRRREIAAAGGNQRLVHVQGDGERAFRAAEIDPAGRQEHRAAPAGAQRGIDQRLRAGEIGPLSDVFEEVVHGLGKNRV